MTNEGPYKASIDSIELRLHELQEENIQAKKIKANKPKGWEESDGVFQHQGFPYISEIIKTKLISRHYDNQLVGHFGIKKIWELIARKYYWPSLYLDVEEYVKSCDICLASKAIRHKPYGDLQSLPIPTYWWKDFLMDFVTGLPISTDWKGNSYDSILVIIDQLTKMVHYKPVKVTIDAAGPAEVIIDVVVEYYGLPNLIVIDRGSLFTSKFWSLLCYFLGIKWRLSTTFHPQTNGQTKRLNNIMKAYLRAFVNFKQNDWARFLLMAGFVYKNMKNASTGHTPFELNCGYHPYVPYKKDVDPRSKSKLANELSSELRELMIVCHENLYHSQEL